MTTSVNTSQLLKQSTALFKAAFTEATTTGQNEVQGIETH